MDRENFPRVHIERSEPRGFCLRIGLWETCWTLNAPRKNTGQKEMAGTLKQILFRRDNTFVGFRSEHAVLFRLFIQCIGFVLTIYVCS